MISTIETKLSLTNDEETILNQALIKWSCTYHYAWSLYNKHHKTEKEIYQSLKELNSFTSNQINSLINKVKTDHSKIKELSKTQLKQTSEKIESINKFIKQELKTIDKLEKA